MPIDKRLHFAAGVIIAVFFGAIIAPAAGFVLAFIAGILKELLDEASYSGYDWKDMVVTWLGGLSGFIIMEVLQWMC